ncbi:hypothetical protein [Fluviicola chungangensis]|uniref:Tetratricopeptide repeat protein n=1 Tax=Fluviicola chungangensis TaxID=2597671 RepID=A0A556MYD9_9FLAO|nr:hypothetical protein [Fluviicola chungangensis]TSJ44934.1 hypothetical protein FO442_10075 [Fluviicola chungangensis]
MKKRMTILGMLCFSTTVFAQRSPADTEDMFRNDPVIIRDTRESSTSEAVKVIQTIRKEVTNSRSAQRQVLTEADFQTLISRADEFMLQRKYDNAIMLYQEILKDRDDRHSKDRILEAEALRARQQKEEARRKQDEILRATAEFASSNTYGKHLVHFTGALISDAFSSQEGTSEALDTTDAFSNFLKPGKYDELRHILRKATYHTLDGIAVPARTRIIVYKNKGCRGEVLLDVTGPAIVNNVLWVDDDRYKEVNTKDFNEELQPYFPQSVRSWSTTNMHTWPDGSLEILVETVE